MSGPEGPEPGSGELHGAGISSTTIRDIPRGVREDGAPGVPHHGAGQLYLAVRTAGTVVMTNFYPYQWDLNYGNPRGLQRDDRTTSCSWPTRAWTSSGIDAVPYIWKELGTSCRNLHQVHTIVRMMRMIVRDRLPQRAAAGRGGHGAGQGGALLRHGRQAGVPHALQRDHHGHHLAHRGHRGHVACCATSWTAVVQPCPRSIVFLNYLRCHDDIGWGLDYGPWLKEHFGTDEVPHKKYLNDYFTGQRRRAATAGASSTTTTPPPGDARLLRYHRLHVRRGSAAD